MGIVEKKPPFAAPLRTTNAINGPSVVAAGHKASIVMALMSREMNKVLIDPILSQQKPQSILPAADERLKPAKRPAPVDEDKPIDRP